MKNISISLALLGVIFSNYAAQKALKRSYIEAFEQELLVTTPTSTEDTISMNATPSSESESLIDFTQATNQITEEQKNFIAQSLAVCSEAQEKVQQEAACLENNDLGTDEEVNTALRTFVRKAYHCCVKDKNDEIAAAWIIAMETEDLALIKKIFVNYFQRYYIDVNYQNASGKTALILASQKGDFDFIIALTLSEGAFLNLRDHEGKNAQFYALANQRNDVAQFLVTLEQSYKQMIS